MLFNLGLTANAAAAHENDLAGSLSQPQPSNSPLSSTSPYPLTIFSPLPGLTALYNKYYKGMEPPVSQRRSLREMAQSPVQSVYSGDGEGSNTEPGFQAASPLGRSQSMRKSSSSLRPKTIYQLAHPAAHSCHRRLRIRPKLLLQLQRVSQTPRPLPILDVLPSSVFLPRLARKFPTIFRGKNGLGPNDLIIVISDFYDKSKVLADLRDIGATGVLSDGNNNDDEHQEVVGTICQLLTEEALSQGKAEICLGYGPVWEATPLSNGSYEFVAHTAEGVQKLRWVLRGAKNRRTSAPPGSMAQAQDSKRFTFSVINPDSRRHPVVASMTRNHLEVNEEYVMPTTTPSSLPTSTMSALSEQYEAETGHSEKRNVVKLDESLRHLIVITSIWVAFREGWSQNFRYNDSALALHTKPVGSPLQSRHTSPTATRDGPDYFSDDRSHAPENGSSTARKHRVSMSNAPSSSDRVKALASGKLAKRSNSTGAAFIERSKRRSASGPKGRTQRHSALLENEKLHDGGLIPETIQQEPASTYDGATRFASPEPSTVPATVQRKSSGRQPASAPAPRELNQKTEPLAPAKPKRRHRISGFFECVFRKHGNH